MSAWRWFFRVSYFHVFLCLLIRDTAFVLFSRQTHSDWLIIFLHKLTFFAILSGKQDFLFSINPLVLFFSYLLITQTSFPPFFPFLDLHQISSFAVVSQALLSIPGVQIPPCPLEVLCPKCWIPPLLRLIVLFSPYSNFCCSLFV